MKIWVNRLFSSITFLTKLPIPYNPSIYDEDFQRNIIFFPTTGIILGIILYVVALVSNIIFHSELAAVVVLATMIILTGGLHLDGVGDSFDGLFSYRDKERILEIMKDSRIGTNGILGILFVVIIKLICINYIIEKEMLFFLVFVPFIGRISLITACYKGKNARKNGMGKTYIGNISTKDMTFSMINAIFLFAIISFIFSSVILFIFDETIYLVLILIITAIQLYVLILRRFVYKKIDGITGDILGLVCETSETLALLLINMVV